MEGVMTTAMGGCLELCSFSLCLVASTEREYERKHQGKEKEKTKCFPLCVFGCGKERKENKFFPLFGFQRELKGKYLFLHLYP